MELPSERARCDGDHRVGFLSLRLVGALPAVPQATQRNRLAILAREQMRSLVALRPRESLPHLSALLTKISGSFFDDVRASASSKRRKRPEDKIKLSRDPMFDEVQTLWPKHMMGERVYERIKLEHLQHVHLLYAYRNSLVHELGAPGYSMDPIADEEPYYLSMSTLGGSAGYGKVNRQSWELAYPIRFFRKLWGRVQDNLEVHLKSNQIDPLAHYQFGSHWLPELN